MSKRQQQAAILAGLLGVCALIYWPRGGRATPVAEEAVPASHAAPAGEPVSPAPALEAEPSDRRVVRDQQQRRVATLGWSRDPFLHGAGAGDMSGLLLSGILWDAREPMAVVNGQSVRVGEALEGYQVLSITQQQVVVTDGMETFQLELSR